jgi:exodeoxyribonuclease VII large subunit
MSPATPRVPAAPDPGRVYKLIDLLREVRRLLEGTYAAVQVEGEVAGLKVHHASGHRYFELRDPGCVLPCVMWRGVAAVDKPPLADGRRVRCRGNLTVWEGAGRFQMIVQHVEPAGAGDIAARIEELKRRLQAEGLMAPERKRPLPPLPRGVGVVTSPDGAALRDVLKVLSRRVPVPVVVASCAVQGAEAPASIVAALERIARRPGIDVVIVTRGGGSAQDLMAYNEEAVARAVAACPLPVITAVGHEVDVTVVDFVSDLRAATPSEAAERAVPTREAVADRLRWAVDRAHRALRARLQHEGRLVDRLRARLPPPERIVGSPRQALDDALDRAGRALGGQLERRRRGLEELRRRLAAAHPRWRLARDQGRLAAARARLAGWASVGLAPSWAHLDLTSQQLRALGPRLPAPHRERFGEAAARLRALSPLAVLARGYSIVRDAAGAILTDASRVAPGDRVDLTLARGRLGCEVREVSVAGEKRGTTDEHR